MPHAIKPPPDSWRPELVGEERVAEWKAMGTRRGGVQQSAVIKMRKLEKYAIAVANGTATARQTNSVRKGGNQKHSSPEEAAAADAASRRARDERRSEERLQFQLERAAGCSFEGCILSECALHTLIEHDHLDRRTKTGNLAHLEGIPKEQEALKTRPLCLWHHFMKTRNEGDRPHLPISDPANSNEFHKLGLLKQKMRCTFPVHSQMIYSPLVEMDATSRGFLDVSHLVRGDDHQGLSNHTRAVRYLADLTASRAEVHCKFCHRLYTLCERAKMYNTACTQQQFAVLLRQSPAFVQYFEIATEGFDWEAEKDRIRAKQSAGLKGKKRKRQ